MQGHPQKILPSLLTILVCFDHFILLVLILLRRNYLKKMYLLRIFFRLIFCVYLHVIVNSLYLNVSLLIFNIYLKASRSDQTLTLTYNFRILPQILQYILMQLDLFLYGMPNTFLMRYIFVVFSRSTLPYLKIWLLSRQYNTSKRTKHAWLQWYV